MDPSPARPPPLHAHLLGTVRVAVGSRVLPESWPRRTARSMLLLLLATPGHRLPRDRVLELLWPAAAPATAANALYLALVALRRVLEPGLARGRDSAYLEVGGDVIAVSCDPPLWVDTDAFEALLADAGAASPSQRRTLLREALALYRGELLADEPYADWPSVRREHLRRERRRAALELAQLEMENGQPLAAIAPLESLIATDPTDEEAYRALIRALAAAGRRDEARRAYERCRDALLEELSVEPDAETEALAAELRTPALRQPIAALAIPSPRFDNLPAPLTPLVGRAHELEAVQDLLWDPAVRLVTLTGPGGVGKTRLALESARQTTEDFADGVCFVPLAPLRDAALVLPTIARTLGLEESGGQSLGDQLRAALRERELLLVLDNFEPVVSAGAELAELLEAASRVKALLTSREPLRLRGEHKLDTPPLSVPGPMVVTAEAADRYEAVTLFVQRARAVRADFLLSDDNTQTVVAICSRLDGLPLAIELAAAQIRAMDVGELLGGLSHRLDILNEGYRDLPARQRTMRDAIAWSYDLLSAAEQRVFRRLAVFAGGFALDAAEAIAGGDNGGPDAPVLDLLASLADQSLVRAVNGPGGEPRFTLLETVREFGQERLDESGESATIRQAHAGYYATFAERAEPELTGPEQSAWLDRLEAEHDNLRAALAWSVDAGDARTGLRLVGALWRFWWVRGHMSEGRRWAEAALARGGGSAIERARALETAGGLAVEQGDYEPAKPLLEAALALAQEAEDRGLAALCLMDLGFMARDQGDYEQATALHGEALALQREAGDRRGVACSLANLGTLAMNQGAAARAEALFAESLATFRAIGDWMATAQQLNNLAILASQRGDHARACRLAEEALVTCRDLGDRETAAVALSALATAVRGQGDLPRAGVLYGEALALFRELGHQPGMAEALTALANLALDGGAVAQALPLLAESVGIVRRTGYQQELAGSLEAAARVATAVGRWEGAARLAGAATMLREAIGVPAPPGEDEVTVTTVRAALGEAAFAAAEAAGRELAVDQAVAEALELIACAMPGQAAASPHEPTISD